MAHQEHVLSVFVASPSDVADERNKLEEVIRELNTTWSRELHLRLELVRWETHAFPGIGVDAQDVINNQIPSDYDIFIGIMWCKFGTPTGRAGSGTIEEFNNAKQRHDNDPSSVNIMFYFKEEAIPPSKIDPAQLQKVNDFRKSLGIEGVLYWPFNTLEQFAQLVRLHLTRQCQTWKSKKDSPLPAEDLYPNSLVHTTNAPISNEEDFGILDLIDIFEEAFSELQRIMERIANATNTLGEKMNERRDEMNSLPRDSQGNVNRKDAKRFIAKAASDMQYYTTIIDTEVPLFNDAMTKGMNSVIRAIAMSADVESEGSREENARHGLNAIVELRQTMVLSKQQIMDFRDTVVGLPRMTSDLNKAKRGVVSSLEKLTSELANGDMLLSEAEKLCRDITGEDEEDGEQD